MEELSEDLYRKIRNADANIVYTAEDMEKFKTASQYHICDGALPHRSTKIDHLANMGN